MARRGVLLCVLCGVLVSCADAFVSSTARPAGFSRSWAGETCAGSVSKATCRELSMKKGFGPDPPKKNPKPMSDKRKEAASAGSAYDDMAAAGIPEYNIFIKPKGTDDYLPCGVMTVPRSTQVSQAVFEQEENLKKAAFKLYDKLQETEEFEYGYNLKMYPDDPVTPLEKRPPTTNPIASFFEGLMSPVNTSGMKGPPIS
ncbi:unnamed protein product [Discosporangium mesarthrocarpum]